MNSFATPENLAKELGVPSWAIRKWLRREHPRPLVDKKTKWILSPELAEEVKRAFSK